MSKPHPQNIQNSLTIRDATPADAPTILDLLDQLGWSSFIRQRVTTNYIRRYMRFPYNRILLAELPSVGQPVGLLSYSVRPDLYHGGDACLVENFVVLNHMRGLGIGSVLFQHLLHSLTENDCATLFVDVEPDNQRALRFYRRQGLNHQVILLERHLSNQG
jgi:ribosomal protein S18 acetylase RimI-like enzyme